MVIGRWPREGLRDARNTVLHRLVRMRTFKVISFSGFVLTERAYVDFIVCNHHISEKADIKFRAFLIFGQQLKNLAWIVHLIMNDDNQEEIPEIDASPRGYSNSLKNMPQI